MPIKTSGVWPLNSNNEVVLQMGTGDTEVVGYLPSDGIPSDANTNRVPVRLVGWENVLQLAKDEDGNTLGVTNRGGSIAPMLRTSKARSNRGAFSLGLGSGVAGTANRNWHLTTVAPRHFNAVKVVYHSFSNVLGTYDRTAVAGSSSLSTASSRVTPDQPWNVGSSVSVPLTGVAGIPAFADTGFIPCRSVPRTDGGKYPLVHVRTHTTLQLPSYATLANLASGWATHNPDWPVEAYAQGGGDYTSVNQTSFNSTSKVDIIVPAWLEFQFDERVITGVGVGDSLMSGTAVADGSPSRMSYAYRANRMLQDSKLPFNFVNAGIPGNTWALYFARAKEMLLRIKPDYVLIPTYTPNDSGATQALVDTQWRNAMEIVNFVIEQINATPILITPFPQNNTTVQTDNFRLSVRARALDSGLYCLDTEPILSDGKSPAKFKTGLNDINDPTHTGSAGNIALAIELVKLLKRIFY